MRSGPLRWVAVPNGEQDGFIRSGFGHARGLRRWQQHELTKQGRAGRITAMPGRHALGLELREAQAIVQPEQEELREQLSGTARGLSDVLLELQEISRGLHPAILAQGGLESALKALALRSPVPVELHVDTGRLPEQLEVTAYYAVSEALTNVLKHAHASEVRVDLDVEDELVHVSIRDDGLGGADPRRGSGLTGLKDRVEALGGILRITSPAGEGTPLLTSTPLEYATQPGA